MPDPKFLVLTWLSHAMILMGISLGVCIFLTLSFVEKDSYYLYLASAIYLIYHYSTLPGPYQIQKWKKKQ